MAEYLVIVESPAKAKTIQKYLGSKYAIEASMGHVRDLPKSTLGVDVKQDFDPKYITIRGKGDLLARLKKQAKAAKKIYLATDPDREGEAISWHLAALLDDDAKKVHRITFNEVTKAAVQKAIKEPRAIDQNLVDAQQARRVLDRIVGYTISPLLWKKVRKRGLSAGRVQSVATRFVVDREREINAFVPKEYWTLDALLSQEGKKDKFAVRFYGKNGKKWVPETEKQVQDIIKEIENLPFTVADVKVSESVRRPAPPFTTSTMQQEASRKLNYTAKKTMSAAQQLYEGVEIKGRGALGLITYMRTDSLRIADEASAAARSFIGEHYGKEFLPRTAPVYKTKKSAQDAHEAIRPTDVTILPESLKNVLPNDLYKLYKLVWERFVASQMANAVYDVVSADITAGRMLFKASDSLLKFAGFTKVYVESKDEEEEKLYGKLPPLKKDEVLRMHEMKPVQHFTQPPARYTEASLIKRLEEDGIGRPSTYAPTIVTLLSRGYVTKEKKALVPTELGTVITDLMVEYFEDVVDEEFTARMEEELDEVEEGGRKWKSVIREFYEPFDKTLKDAEDKIGHIEVKDEVSDVPCEKCGRMMVYKMGRYGKFLACPGFPECRNAKPIVNELKDIDCPKCGKKVLVKKSKRGKTYYGCEDATGCGFMSWDAPTKEKCPKCGERLYQKNGKNGKKYCAAEGCGYNG